MMSANLARNEQTGIHQLSDLRARHTEHGGCFVGAHFFAASGNEYSVPARPGCNYPGQEFGSLTRE